MQIQRRLSNILYVTLSVVIAWFLYEIVIPSLSRVLACPEYRHIFHILFPSLALFGAVVTLKKKYGVRDLFMNVTSGLWVIVAIRIFQHNLRLFRVVMVVSGIIVICACAKFILVAIAKNKSTSRIVRGCIYKARRVAHCVTLVFLPSVVVWGVPVSTDISDFESVFLFGTVVESDPNTPESENVLSIVDSETWLVLDNEARFQELVKAVTYFSQDLGLDDTKVMASLDGETGCWGSYCDMDGSIKLNFTYLSECTLSDALDTAAHECHHKYQHKIIDSIDEINIQNADSASSDYLEEALALKAANESYWIDRQTYEGYYLNLLEVRAREYAKEQIEELKEAGVLEREKEAF